MPATDGQCHERRAPVSEAVITRAAAAGPEEARMAADAAAAVFPEWSDSAPEIRARMLTAAAERLRECSGELAAIAAAEVGSAPDWIAFDIEIACETLRAAAALAPRIGETVVAGGRPGVACRLNRRPAGVVLGIAPWNAPVTLAVRALAAPLACGNTVVLKGSELCPKTHETVAAAVIAAGLPAGVLNFITNAPDSAEPVVEALIAHPAVRRVNFTGSTRVGRRIAALAARHLKPALLELSGKGTMIVLADADLEAAASAAVHGAFFNQGQICMSTDRIIVEDRVADAFARHLVARVQDLRADPRPGGARPLGSLISPQAVMRVRALIDDALAQGAVLLTGGEAVGTLLQPAVLDRVAPGMAIYSEECFGPVAALIRAADAEEAMTLANDSDYGLVAAVFTRDLQRAAAIARELETGIVHINGSTVYDDPAMPFGGMKASGHGRFGGDAALHEFTELQWVAVHGAPAACPSVPAVAAGQPQQP